MPHTLITPARPPHFQHQGFTLIETMVVVALMAILAGMAAPSFTGAFQRYRVSTTTDDLMASFYLARTEAIRSGQQTVVGRQSSCGVTLKDTQDWSCGWQVFVDSNTNNTLDASDILVRQIDAPNRVTVRKTSTVNAQFVAFDRFGQVTQRGQSLTIQADGQETEQGQRVCFSQGTRFRVC